MCVFPSFSGRLFEGLRHRVNSANPSTNIGELEGPIDREAIDRGRTVEGATSVDQSSRRGTFNGKFGAIHGTDVGTALHSTRGAMSGDTPDAHKTADRHAAAWVAFAHSGNPDCNAIPK
jgi:hypothetical protein